MQRIKHVRLSPRWRLSLYYSAMRIADGSTTRFLCVILRGLGRQAGCCETDKEVWHCGERERERERDKKEKERERERRRGTSHEQPMKSSRPPSAIREISKRASYIVFYRAEFRYNVF